MTITSVTQLSVQINIRHRQKKCPVTTGQRLEYPMCKVILTLFVRTNQIEPLKAKNP